jgi:predicted dehydrogenase
MKPVKVAVVGLGRRAWSVYFAFLPYLSEFIELTAVCDPIKAVAEEASKKLGIPAYSSLRELVKQRPMEAVILVSPIVSHHSQSVFLSRNKIPHACETSMAVTVSQAREMVKEAESNGVLLHVCDQSFRREIIVFAKKIMDSGAIGDVKRILNLHGHTGYHNNSVWQYLTGEAPVAVNALSHTMPVARHLDGAAHWQERENYKFNAMHFNNGMLIIDNAGNIKSTLGRYPRPGYLEIDGTKGAIIEQCTGDPAPWEGKMEVRVVSPQDMERGAYAESFKVFRHSRVEHSININERIPHECEFEKLHVRLPDRELEYVNPMLKYGITNAYFSSVAQSLLDFVYALRNISKQVFTPEMAAMSHEMESACNLSVELNGARVDLPVEGDSKREKEELETLRQKYGVNPMDVEAMIDKSFGINYDSTKSSYTSHRG